MTHPEFAGNGWRVARWLAWLWKSWDAKTLLVIPSITTRLQTVDQAGPSLDTHGIFWLPQLSWTQQEGIVAESEAVPWREGSLGSPEDALTSLGSAAGSGVTSSSLVLTSVSITSENPDTCCSSTTFRSIRLITYCPALLHFKGIETPSKIWSRSCWKSRDAFSAFNAERLVSNGAVPFTTAARITPRFPVSKQADKWSGTTFQHGHFQIEIDGFHWPEEGSLPLAAPTVVEILPRCHGQWLCDHIHCLRHRNQDWKSASPLPGQWRWKHSRVSVAASRSWSSAVRPWLQNPAHLALPRLQTSTKVLSTCQNLWRRELCTPWPSGPYGRIDCR